MLDFKTKAIELLKEADIEINGSRPWDIQVHNEDVYERVLRGGTLAFGEAYMDGWFDIPRLDLFFEKAYKAKLDEKVQPKTIILYYLKSLIFNPQANKKNSFKVGEEHYDVGNDLYKIMLDKRMTYSCAYWDKFQNLSVPTNLDEAQENKLDMICQKLGLKPGKKVLDVGCGWGSFMLYAAEKYGVEVDGVTISKEQKKYIESIKNDLPVRVFLKDYREVEGKYDYIVSIGMFEHVGYKNYKVFMKKMHDLLKDDGLFLLHTIGGNVSTTKVEPWIEKYIFPNSMLPSMAQIAKSVENIFVIEDWHNIGVHYDKTLMTWYDNFVKGWPKIKNNYSERFYRMWVFYLLSSAATFRVRMNQVWQIVFSKNGVIGGYKSLR